jgi:hypothetical protein
MQLYIGGAKLTVGRIGILLLLLPAVVKLFQAGRRFLAADFIVVAIGIWMVVAALYVDGVEDLSSAAAQALEFSGGYLVARAFFFGSAALKGFLGALKPIALTAIMFGVADRVTQRLAVHEFFGSLMHVPPIDAQERMGVLRATSSFDHAILFGLFCAVVGAMLLYSEERGAKRIAWVGLCLLGSYLSLSSSSFMAFGILFAVYGYNRLLMRFPWRWSVFWAMFSIFVLAIVLVSRDPLGWVLSHLTLDPESGYFRLMEWNAAFYMISLAPWAGYAFFNFGTAELYSVDCVWLCMALRYGLPLIALLFLVNIVALLPGKRSATPDEPFIGHMRSALSVVLVMFMFVGLTAHLWNYMWIFWGVCLGMAISLRELSLCASDQSYEAREPAGNERWKRMAPA